jgi:predicted phage terminase large subunit-like protein
MNRAPHSFERVVVGVDPATTFGPDSDETGIIVAARGHDQHGYVLDDLSGRYPPEEWARRAIGAYRRYSADRVVAEVNQGGAMVEATLRSVDPAIPFTAVHASRGKMTRAEPISALYERGLVHHVGVFGPLEDQMTSYDGARAGGSPDRLDALVWALTELMLGEPPGAFIKEASLLPRPASDGSARPPIEMPVKELFCAAAYAAAGTGLEPDALGVVYVGLSFAPCLRTPPLVILDWDLTEIRSGTLDVWFVEVFRRLKELGRGTAMSAAFGAGTGSAGLVVEASGVGSVLYQQAAQRYGTDTVLPVLDKTVREMSLPERAVAASGFVHSGHTQLTRLAHEKLTNYKGQTRNHFLHQISAFGVGQKPDEAGVLLAAFSNAVVETFRSPQMQHHLSINRGVRMS